MPAKKNCFLNLSIMCIFTCIAYTGMQQTKGRTMTETQPGQTLDLKTFDSNPLNSTLKHKILSPGSGQKLSELKALGKTVNVDYSGWLLNGNKIGKLFDSSLNPGRSAFEFKLGMGQVIAGWDLSLADMKIGEKRLVVIPANLGYGARGAGAAIPPNATLVFEIDLHGVR